MPRTLRFSLLAYCLFLVALRAHAAPDEYSVALQAGEIRFDGQVTIFDENKKTLRIVVSSFTLPNGKTSKLPLPKPKTIIVGEQTEVDFQSPVGRAFSWQDDLQPGTPVIVAGKDMGSGKDLPARVLVVFGANASAPAAGEGVEKDDPHEPVVRAGETRYDGKITGILSDTDITVSIFSTTNADGKTTELFEPQAKTIRLSMDSLLRSRGDAKRKLKVADLKIGQRVTFVGKDGGTKTVKAREIAVWDEGEGKHRTIGTVEISPPVSMLIEKGDEAQRARDLPTAAKAYEQALRAGMDENDTPGQGLSYGRLGLIYDDLGQPKRALENYLKAREIWRRVGNTTSEATTLLNLSSFYQTLKDLKNARESAESAIRLYQGAGNTRGVAIGYGRLGDVQSDQDDWEEAVASWQQALSLSRQSQERDEEISSLGSLVIGYTQLKQPAKAHEVLDQLVALWPQLPDRSDQARANYMLGVSYKYMNQKAKAEESFRQAQTLYTQAGERGNADAMQKEIEELNAPDEKPEEAKEKQEGAIEPADGND